MVKEKCLNCKNETNIETEVYHDDYIFCSSDCLQFFLQKKYEREQESKEFYQSLRFNADNKLKDNKLKEL